FHNSSLPTVWLTTNLTISSALRPCSYSLTKLPFLN
ncbi:hypothetical protein X975_10657, partial [Stegodyphus mimosarum]